MCSVLRGAVERRPASSWPTQRLKVPSGVKVLTQLSQRRLNRRQSCIGRVADEFLQSHLVLENIHMDLHFRSTLGPLWLRYVIWPRVRLGVERAGDEFRQPVSGITSVGVPSNRHL